MKEASEAQEDIEEDMMSKKYEFQKNKISYDAMVNSQKLDAFFKEEEE